MFANEIGWKRSVVESYMHADPVNGRCNSPAAR